MPSQICPRGVPASPSKGGSTGCLQGKELGPRGLGVGVPEHQQLVLTIEGEAPCMPRAMLLSGRSHGVLCSVGITPSVVPGWAAQCCWEGNEPQLLKLSD